MLEKIEVKGFYIYGYKESKSEDKIVDFKKNKVIITGGNSIGKTSFINLIVGIMKNNDNWYKHVRYSKITFHFKDDEKIILQNNDEISRLKEIKSKDRENFYNEIQNIKVSWKTFEKWIIIFKDDECQKQVKKMLNKDFKFNKFFEEINNILENSNTKLNKEIRINEVNQVINCEQYKPIDFINHLIKEIKRNVNNINSSLSYSNNNQKEINKIHKKMNNNFEYFSIFRQTSEFINESFINDSRYYNQMNKIAISFEISKISFTKQIEEFKKNIKEEIYNFKNNFFTIIANNNELKIKNDQEKEEIIKNLENLSDISKDEDIINLCKNLKQNIDFKNKIINFIYEIGTDKIKKMENLFKKIKTFINKMNEVLKNKKIIFESNELYLENKNKKTIVNNENILSAGEKQMFSLLYIFCITDKEFIIIDEPEISLSIRWQQVLQKVMNDSSAEGKKILFVTHSPYLISKNDVINETILKFN